MYYQKDKVKLGGLDFPFKRTYFVRKITISDVIYILYLEPLLFLKKDAVK